MRVGYPCVYVTHNIGIPFWAIWFILSGREYSTEVLAIQYVCFKRRLYTSIPHRIVLHYRHIVVIIISYRPLLQKVGMLSTCRFCTHLSSVIRMIDSYLSS